jgi:ABC-type multidrug transport system fused ATPase/permease subunit
LSVDIQDVSFAYGARLGEDDDDTPVLHDISLHISAGQHIALVGPSGSGKTTIARLIARLTDPTIGRVQIGGVTLTEVLNDELRRRLIVVPQEPFLFANTISYNLQFAEPSATSQNMVAAFAELGLSDWLESLPLGLDTHVGQRGSSLSAGERQLVALVRASMVKPDVLVLDEATSSVDSLTEVRISRALERLALGRTTISIAHRLSTASRADRVVMLENGRIVEDGSHLALMQSKGKYAALYDAWLNSTNGETHE